MPVKELSSYAAEQKIAYTDALAQRECGMSFSRYCETVLLDFICQTGQLPSLEKNRAVSKAEALEAIKFFASVPHDSSVAQLSDDEVGELLGARYA